MITGTYCEKKGRAVLEIRGHADYGEYGKDIVCAAVSALVASLAISLERREGVVCLLHSGYARMESSHCSHLELFRFVVRGLKRIELLYPYNFSIIIKS